MEDSYILFTYLISWILIMIFIFVILPKILETIKLKNEKKSREDFDNKPLKKYIIKKDNEDKYQLINSNLSRKDFEKTLLGYSIYKEIA